MKWLDGMWWQGLQRVIALECPEESGGSYRVLVLKKDQNKVEVESYQQYSSISATLDFLHGLPNLPIVLCQFGDFAFERILPPELADNPVSAVLGVSVEESDDFRLMEFAAHDAHLLVSLIRKDKLAEWMAPFEKVRERVIEVCFSPAILFYLLPQIKADFFSTNTELAVGEKRYLLRDGFPAEPEAMLDRDYDRLSIGDVAIKLGVPDAYALLYAAVVYTWMRPREATPADPVAERFKEFTTIGLLKNIAVMAAIFVGLWAVSLMSLRIQGETKKEELEYTYQQNIPVLNAIGNLDEKISARESLRVQLGTQTLKATRASWYYDRLASIVPTDIRLREVIYRPEEDDFKRVGLREPEDYEFIVRGECAVSGPVADLSTLLEQQSWIARLNPLRSEMSLQSGLYEFVFLLKLSDV